MFRIIQYFFLFIAFSSISTAQVRVIKPVKTHPTKTNLSFGLGVTTSVLYLARNTSDNNRALGNTSSLIYGSAKTLRVSFDYTNYGKINISPTWYNIKANTFELNLHVMLHSKSNLSCFPIFGLSYNLFKGFFTGQNDYLNLSSYYRKNEYVTTRWLGLNAGLGLEYSFKRFVIYGTYKMRVGFATGNQLNILDLAITGGLRYNFVVPSIYKLFRGTRNRYFFSDKRSGSL